MIFIKYFPVVPAHFYSHLEAVWGHLGPLTKAPGTPSGPPEAIWEPAGEPSAAGQGTCAFSYGFGTLFKARGWGLESKIPNDTGAMTPNSVSR